MYRPSKLLNIIDCKNGNFAIFHPLNMETLFVSMPKGKIVDLNELSKHDDELRRTCVNRQFLVSLRFDEKVANACLAKDLHVGKISFSVFKMVITTLCNLKCKYCLIKRNIEQRCNIAGHLELKTAKKLLSFFWEACQKSPSSKRTLMLYGGEPLLNVEVLKYVILASRQAETNLHTNGPLEIILETNGILVTKDIAKFLKDNDVFCIVSIDGLSKIHNYYRPKIDGSNSWKDSIRGYNTLRNEGVKTVISSVFSSKFAQNCEEAITYLIKEFNPESIGLNLYHVVENNKIKDDKTLELIPQYIKAWDIASSKGLYIEHIMRRIRPLVNLKIRTVDCQACGHRLVSDEIGRIGICEGLLGKSKYFKFRNKIEELYRDEVFISWSKRTPLTMKNCHACIAQGVCGGGCVYNGLIMKNDLYAADPYFCEASKQIVEWAINRWYQRVKKNGKLGFKKPWVWLDNVDRAAVLGKVALNPFIPLQHMSLMPEKLLSRR